LVIKHSPRQRAELAGGVAFGFAGRLTRPNLGTPVGGFACRSGTERSGAAGEKRKCSGGGGKPQRAWSSGQRGGWDGLPRRSPAGGKGKAGPGSKRRGFESGDSNPDVSGLAPMSGGAPSFKALLGISKAGSGTQRLARPVP